MHVDVDRLEAARLAVRTRGLDVIVDRLAEDGGPGDGFRPTELLLGALGACMAGTVLTFAERQELDLTGLSFSIDDEVADHPKRVAAITVVMRVGGELSARQLESLGRVAKRCKIHNTLDDGPEIVLRVERLDDVGQPEDVGGPEDVGR